MLGLDQYGTRVVQKLIDKIGNDEDTLYFIKHLESFVVTFLKSNNAYHIVIKSLHQFQEEKLLNIYKIIATNIIGVSNHKIGCSAIQKCIDAVPQSTQATFVGFISKNASLLIFNKYGYYVLCHALNKRIKSSIQIVVEILTRKLDFINVCKQQQSRVVLEKCLEYSDSDIRKYIISLMKTKEAFNEIVTTESGIKGKTFYLKNSY